MSSLLIKYLLYLHCYGVYSNRSPVFTLPCALAGFPHIFCSSRVTKRHMRAWSHIKVKLKQEYCRVILSNFGRNRSESWSSVKFVTNDIETGRVKTTLWQPARNALWGGSGECNVQIIKICGFCGSIVVTMYEIWYKTSFSIGINQYSNPKPSDTRK